MNLDWLHCCLVCVAIYFGLLALHHGSMRLVWKMGSLMMIGG